MRTPEEIEEALHTLGNCPESLDWTGDNFQYGLYIGKVLALGWAAGEKTSGELGIHYTFDDWQREVKDAHDDLRDALGGSDET